MSFLDWSSRLAAAWPTARSRRPATQGATGPIALGGQRTRLAIGAGPIEAFTGAMNVLTDEQAAAYGVPRPPQPGPAQNGGGYAAAWPAPTASPRSRTATARTATATVQAPTDSARA